ncbi:MAG: hypothetical protein G01um10143_25 [Parcubacteria group bacterium Gr01-1014_3]|nr:MAG: hypothetical protein G01um10143_25 [Parcubacteria group bacterium Gr01-1014_3]
MLQFILQTIVFLSLGLVLYLFARALPRIKEEEIPNKPLHPFEKAMSRLPLAKIDASINSVIERILRKFRVVLMKVDHLMTTYISKVKKTDGGDKPGNPPEQK